MIRVLDKEDQPPSDSTGFTHAERHVNFTADTAHSAEAESVKRPFNVCSLSTRQVFPQVFANGPHLCNTHTTPTVPSGSQCNSHENQCGLRRAGSLSSRFRSLLSQPIMPSAHPLPQLMAVVPPESPNGIETEARGSLHLSRTVSDIPLLVSTGLVAVCAEFLVDSIDYLVESTGVSQAFIVSIILPIVGNAAEHITAVVVASENKIDLAIGVALGSSMQIALSTCHCTARMVPEYRDVALLQPLQDGLAVCLRVHRKLSCPGWQDKLPRRGSVYIRLCDHCPGGFLLSLM